MAKSSRLRPSGVNYIDMIAALQLDARSGSLARRCLRVCGYRDDLVRDDVQLPSGRNALVAYAHRPFDTRSACIVVLPSSRSPMEEIAACRDVGASLVFVAADTRWDAWAQTRGEPKHLRSLQSSEVENYFQRNQEVFSPGTIFRAKTWFRAGVGRQLDFVDTGLLPMLEQEAGARLLDLFERMVAVTMNSLRWNAVPNDDKEAHWLTKANFWLLAAKLLHDKRVPRFINLDLLDVPTVFNHVAVHYDPGVPSPPRVNGRLAALREAARIAAAGPAFHNISAETLGMLYEEALISPTTRKLLGTHRTPTYLVDYMLAKLGGWIGELGPQRCCIFEPACGHAPFLTGALRLLSDMLPAKIAGDQKQRRGFLRDHLRGCDHDPFALEIARLELTLADIPNENGWVLEPGDMFAGTTLATEARTATVVLANPPFEKEQAAKFLQRVVPALQPGTVFGFVLPLNELAGSSCEMIRRQLLAGCEILEISVFPDGMFRFASAETGIVLGRKHEAKRTVVPGAITFRRVRETRRDAFREHYLASWQDTVDAAWLATSNKARFIVPELRRVWDSLEGAPRFQELAEIGQGLIHHSVPKGTITESDHKIEGFVLGFAGMDDSPDTHLSLPTKWLNLTKDVVRFAGGKTGVPQVLLNYAPVDRDIWRLKAFMDPIGRPATSRMLRIRQKPQGPSLVCLWALCNSPIANAYSFALGSKRDIPAGLMRRMPVPRFATSDTLRLESAVNAYLKVAVEFTAKFQKLAARTKSRLKLGKHAKPGSSGQLPLLPDEPTLEAVVEARDHLRALHWRVDAEVLRLYALPPNLERELLDAFDGVRRVGVPFEQTGYIPLAFRDVLTLDEFLHTTDEWDATEARRCQLIETRIKNGRRTAAEESEFRELQRLLKLRRRLYSPLPIAEIKALRERLKDGTEWGSDD